VVPFQNIKTNAPAEDSGKGIFVQCISGLEYMTESAEYAVLEFYLVPVRGDVV